MTPSQCAFIKDNDLLSHEKYYGKVCTGLRPKSNESSWSLKMANLNSHLPGDPLWIFYCETLETASFSRFSKIIAYFEDVNNFLFSSLMTYFIINIMRAHLHNLLQGDISSFHVWYNQNRDTSVRLKAMLQHKNFQSSWTLGWI